uniref:Uncharacterized protein n=1 Tax=Anguilla anguilla TaxID=7936 RepID=A0A0E9U890_ANGAN
MLELIIKLSVFLPIQKVDLKNSFLTNSNELHIYCACNTKVVL